MSTKLQKGNINKEKKVARIRKPARCRRSCQKWQQSEQIRHAV